MCPQCGKNRIEQASVKLNIWYCLKCEWVVTGEVLFTSANLLKVLTFVKAKMKSVDTERWTK